MMFRGLMLPLAVVPVLLAGCASTSSYDRASNVGAPRQVAAAPPPVEIEDDGLPAQTPPLLRQYRPEPDDPSEPYSPNYGSGIGRRADALPPAAVNGWTVPQAARR
jgi:hypothetical protein